MSKTTLPDIELSQASPDDIPSAAALAARALFDDPISPVIFGRRAGARLSLMRTTFEWTLRLLDSPVLLARRQGTIVGIAALATPHDCLVVKMAGNEKRVNVAGQSVGIAVPPIPVRTLISLLRLGPSGLSRFSAWGEAIAVHDLPVPHYHLELAAVEPGLKGMGIGSMLMDNLCEKLRGSKEPATLETTTEPNVRFYERFGFGVRERVDVLGVSVWFMTREGTTG